MTKKVKKMRKHQNNNNVSKRDDATKYYSMN
jgi:hypothetical protein